MSSGTERRLRRKCIDSIEKQSSETLNSSSSSQKSDVIVKKRIKRKKIRNNNTQDIDRLSSDLTLVGYEESQPKATRTRRKKPLYSLPQIVQFIENSSPKPNETGDSNYVGLVSKKKGRKRSRKQNSHSEQDESDSLEKTLTYKKNIIKKQNTKKYQSPNSTSDSNSDSEVEITQKSKRPRNKRKSNSISTDAETKEMQLDMDQCYTNRIKKLLSDEPLRKTRSGRIVNNPLNPVPRTKSKRISSNIKKSPKDIQQKTPKTDEQSTSSKQSISVRLSHQSTPHPKIKLRLSSYDTTEQPATKNTNKFSEKKASGIGTKTHRSSTLSEYVNFNMDFESDDVFLDSSETQVRDVVNVNFNPEQNNVSMKMRKSVRFMSPEQSIRRETIILPKSTPHKISINKLTMNDDISGIFDMLDSTNKSARRSSTFEITSPQVMQSRNSSIDMSQNTKSNGLIVSHRQSKVNSTTMMNNSTKRKSRSMELFSPQSKSFKSSNSDSDISIRNVVQNVTPSANNTETNVSRLNATENVPHILNIESTFSKECPMVTKLDTSKAYTPKLIRTATFTKDGETERQISDPPSVLKNTSILSTSSNQIDTSKVNKRKRWDKSRLSTSFLDNSFDIGNTSAPWVEDSINKSINLSLNKPIQKLEVKNTSTINNLSVSNISSKVTPRATLRHTKGGTPPSASSTPFPKGKTNLLKKVLVKDQHRVTVKEDGKTDEKRDSRKFVRTKVPNFALIHKRALDKMENIKEMSERKAVRAKLLLSGHKPTNETIRKASSNRKELKFSPTRLKSTPLKAVINRSLNKSNILVTEISKVSPSLSNPKVVNKENRLTPIEKRKALLKVKSQIPVKAKIPNTVISEKKGFTRFGFKLRTEGVKVTTKDEQIKAVAQKTKIMKNSLEERRTVIQGVRSNRRFELLMQKRNK